MHWIQVLKGWLFIAVIAVSLYFIAWTMERSHLQAAKTDLEQTNQFQPSPPQQHDQANDPSKSLSPSHDSTLVDDSQNNDGDPSLTPSEEFPPIIDSDPNTSAEMAKSQLSDPRPLPKEDQATMLPESISFIDPELEADLTKPIVQPASEVQLSPLKTDTSLSDTLSRLCATLPKVDGAQPRADLIKPNATMLIWNQIGAQPVSALFDGEIVHIYVSPYTGKTVYQLSDDGRFCVMYGYLGQMADLVMKGNRLACGQPIGQTQASETTPNLAIQILAVEAGAAWWQSHPLDPLETLPQWAPLEPEAELNQPPP